MNVPHDKICPECGRYMNWVKDHYECECDYKGRFMWRWQMGTAILTILALIYFTFQYIA